MAPEPRRVWLVRPGRTDSVPGVLALERETLTFVSGPEEEHTLPIPLNRIRRVRRRRLTPILEVVYTSARAEPSTVFFYFARPPPLPGVSSGTGRRRPGSFLLPSKGMEQTASAMALRAGNKRWKTTIEAWVEAIGAEEGGG